MRPPSPSAVTRSFPSTFSRSSSPARCAVSSWATMRVRWCIVRSRQVIAELKKTTEQKMQKSLEALKHDLAKVRTGRAHTGLLDHVQVEYYGSMMPINQVANITLVDARTIGVQPYEKSMTAKVEKAIRDCDLGLNPAAQGEMIR